MKLPDNTVCTHMPSPLGQLTLAAAQQALVGVWFEDQAHRPDLSHCSMSSSHPALQIAIQQLVQYFGGQRTRFELPLNLSTGTDFQSQVWQALLAIPCGQTWSYKALSAAIGRPAATRAVGAAVGRNPFGIIVPCHRVIGTNGSLTGYAGGLERKTALLHLEGAL